MEKIIIDLEAKTDKAVKGVEEVTKSVDNLSKEVKESNKSTEKSLNGVQKASKSVVGGLKKIGGTLKAIGFGLLITALANIKELFAGNQKAVDFFNVAFETASIVVGETVKALTNVYDAVSKSSENFDALGKVMSGLLTVAINPFKLAFFGIKLGIQQTQLAWENSVFGGKDPETIKQLTADVKETKEALSEVAYETALASGEIINNFSEAVTEASSIGTKVIEEVGKINVTNAIETAKANVELTKSAEIAAATQGLIFEKFDRQAEKLRQVRDTETVSIEERKKANDELLIEIDKAEKASLGQAKRQLEIANANLAKDKDNVEAKVAQIEAEKELAGVKAQFEGIRSEQISNANALDKETLEITNSKLESESALSIERKRFNAEQIQDELTKQQALDDIDKLEQDKETLRLQAIVDNANAGTQAKIDAQIVLDEFKEQSRQTNLTRDKQIFELEKLRTKQTLSDAKGSFDQAAELAGKDSKIGKAMAIASATISGVEGVQNAYSTAQKSPITTFFPAYPLVQAGLAGAVSLKNIAAIKSVNPTAGGGSAPPVPKAPPSFNVVGSSETSQLAESIGGQSQKPVKAFVVSNDVSTAQEMDRNIVEGASL